MNKNYKSILRCHYSSESSIIANFLYLIILNILWIEIEPCDIGLSVFITTKRNKALALQSMSLSSSLNEMSLKKWL